MSELTSSEGPGFDADTFFKQLTVVEESHKKGEELDPNKADEHFLNKVYQITQRLSELRNSGLVPQALKVLIGQMLENEQARYEGEIRGMEGRLFTHEEIAEAFPTKRK